MDADKNEPVEADKPQDESPSEPAGAPPIADEPEVTDSEAPEGDNAHAVEPSTMSPEEEAAAAANQEEAPKGHFAKLKRFGHAYWARKKWTVPVTILALIVLLLAIPLTRYTILGVFWKENLTVAVVDSSTSQPVTGASVSADGKTMQTDNKGLATLHIAVGPHTLTVSKKYYKTYTTTVTVKLFGDSGVKASVVATGRPVPVTVTDFITGKPLENAVLKSAGTTTKTDKSGKATLVLPTGSASQKATISLAGYNTQAVSVLVTSRVVTTNNFTLTSTGKLYFLSNQSGTIDVVKTDLDGKNRKIVLAGTGKEDTYSTALLASRDWKYLALLSKRDGQQGVYLINTSNDNATNIDGGSAQATFTLVGWSGDTFVYEVNRTNVPSWQSGATAIKSYDASSAKLYSIDQTTGEGTSQYDYGATSFSTISILNGELAYTKNWGSSSFPNHLTGKSDSLMTVKPDGSNKKSVKDFPIPAGQQYYYGINVSQYEPYSLYLQVPNNDGTNTYYDYENGTVNAKGDVTDDTFNKSYPTYLVSPSSKATFWSEVRDNKNTLFVGDSNGASGKQIASLSDYVPYGWYSDSYLLVSKNGSELFAMPTDGSKPPVKITDYYKPQLTYKGYGGGYGGL